MKGGIRNSLKASFKEYGVHIIYGLFSGFELREILIEISVNLVNISIVFDCTLHKFAQIGAESGQSHEDLVNELCHHLGFPAHKDIIILFIGMECCFGLFGEAAVQTTPHLFVVLCHLLV